MQGPTAYTPTSSNIALYTKRFFATNNIPQGLIDHKNEMGSTYVFPFFEIPDRFFPGDPAFYKTIEHSRNTWEGIETFKLFGPNKRASQPVTFNTNKPYEFLSDRLGTTYFYNRGIAENYYNSDWSLTTGITGKTPNPWGLCGACAINNLWDKICSAIQSAGISLDYVILDREGSALNSYMMVNFFGLAGAINVLENPKYSESFQGLSSWKYYFEIAGGTSFNINDTNLFQLPPNDVLTKPWDYANDKYDALLFNNSHYNPIKKYFPNVSMSNYGNYASDGFTANNTNVYIPNLGEAIGNASSSFNYPTLQNNGLDGNPVQWISVDNPNSSEILATDPDQLPSALRKSSTLLGGGWAPFKKAIQQVRMARRNSPELPHHPWIGAVNMFGEVSAINTVWTIGSSNQSDYDVIKNSWYKQNISNIIKGITSPNGITNAYSVILGNTGTTFSLDYFLYGTTPGATYTFSYYIDLSKGFTTPYFKLQNWKKYFSTDQAGEGLTFTQILPINAGPFFKERLIGFTTGNSGWTKVAFQFKGITNPYLALSSLYGTFSNNYGHTAHLWNPSLEIEYSNGSTASIGITSYDAFRYEYSAMYPPIAWCDSIKGYNPHLRHYFSRRGGNSAYYYETLRHFLLLGSKTIPFFNPDIYIDRTNSIIPNPSLDESYNAYLSTALQYFNSSGYDKSRTIQYYKDFDNCVSEVNTMLGGFTLTTANFGWENWLGKYFSSGAPIKGNTSWLWRITSLPGYTLYVNGETLSAREKVGTWVTTNSSSLSGVTISSTKWELPQEPSVISPVKDFNFAGMTNTAQLLAAGFTFTRGSTASYINETGKLIFVGPNQARFAYDPETLEAKGLVLEAPATNLLNWSESFATSGGCNNNWINFNLQRTSGNTSPADTLNSILFTATGSNATLISSSPSGITTHIAFSFWMKGQTGNENVYYTINGGTQWSQIQGLSTQWKRYQFTPFTGDGQVGFKIGNTGQSVFIWGAQLEPRLDTSLNNLVVNGIASWDYYMTIATSYVPSGSTRGTRSADLCSIRGNSFTSWFGNTYGTVIYEATSNNTFAFSGTDFGPDPVGNPIPTDWHSLRLFGNDKSIILSSLYNTTFGLTAWTNEVVGDWWVSYPYPRRTADTPYKFSFSYEPNKLTLIGNRNVKSNVKNDFISLPPNMSRMYLAVFTLATQAEQIQYPYDTAYIKRIRYWNQVLPEKLLQLLNTADNEMLIADNSIDYTWEKFNAIRDEYGFTQYYGSYLV